MVREILAIIFFPSILLSGEYFITYKLYSQNFVLYNENIYISKVMVENDKKPKKFFTFSTEYEKIDDLITYEKYKIIDTILQQYAHIQSKTYSNHSIAKINTHLQIYPKRIKVEINNGLAKIGLY